MRKCAWLARLTAVVHALLYLHLEAADGVLDEIDSFLFDTHERPLTLPLKLNVGLLGFGSSTPLHIVPEGLLSVLDSAMPFRAPKGVRNGDLLGVEFSLQYNVVSLDEHLADIEAAIAHAAKPVPGSGDTFEVEATDIENVFDGVFHTEFASDGTYNDAQQPSPDEEPYAILLINPQKAHMAPQMAIKTKREATSSGPFDYYYRYQQSACGVTWISSRRYAVVDVAAGPCEYGETTHRLGLNAEGDLAGELTLPKLQALQATSTASTDDDAAHRRAQATSVIASVIISAVQHLFVPDTKQSMLPRAEKILVAVIALCNHDEFDPLEPGHRFSVDVESIRSAARSLALPGQEVSAVTAVHNIHEHEGVAVAAMKAMKRDSRVGGDHDSEHFSQTYLDSRVLRDEFRRSSDTLTSGLIDAGSADTGTPFGGQAGGSLSLHEELSLQREFAADETAGSVISSAVTPPLYPDSQTRWKDEDSKSTRVLPVYILSLLGVENECLIDHRELAVETGDMVIALQHDGTAHLPYQSLGTQLTSVPAAPTRAIIGALAAAMTNLLPPYQRAAMNRVSLSASVTSGGGHAVDHIWAVGHHPFGPFANSTAFSQILLDSALRNAIICSISATLSTVHASIGKINRFSNEFLYDPHGDHTDDDDLAGVKWLLGDPDAQLEAAVLESIPRDVTTHLRAELAQIEKRYLDLSEHLFNMRFGLALTECQKLELKVCEATHWYVPRSFAVLLATSRAYVADGSSLSPMLRSALVVMVGGCVLICVLALTTQSQHDRMQSKRGRHNW